MMWLVLVAAPTSALGLDLRFGFPADDAFARFAGRTVARLIDRHAVALHCQAVAGPDDVHNLTNLQGGSIDLTLVDGLTLQAAVQRTGRFAFLDVPYDQLRCLVTLYRLPATLVVQSGAGILSLDDLAGKRFNAGVRGSAARSAADFLLEAKGWTPADFALFQELSDSHGEDTMAFCHGTVQAMVHVGGHPDDGLRQLFRLCGAALVDLRDPETDALVAAHPALVPMEIPAGTYPSQSRSIATFGTRVVLAVSADLDDETAGQVVRVLTGQRRALQAAHPALVPKTVADCVLPPHPAVAR